MSSNQKFTPYDWDELSHKWEHDEMTVEQLAGQLLVWSRKFHEMLVQSQREQESLPHSLADHDARLQGLAERL